MTEKDAPPLKIFGALRTPPASPLCLLTKVPHIEHSRAEGFSTLNGEAPFAKDANGIQM